MGAGGILTHTPPSLRLGSRHFGFLGVPAPLACSAWEEAFLQSGPVAGVERGTEVQRRRGSRGTVLLMERTQVLKRASQDAGCSPPVLLALAPSTPVLATRYKYVRRADTYSMELQKLNLGPLGGMYKEANLW